MISNINSRLEKIISFVREKGNDEPSQEVLDYSAKTIKETLSLLDFSSASFARYLDLANPRLVRHWCSGKYMPRVGTLLVLQGLVNQYVAPPEMTTDCVAALNPYFCRLIEAAKRSGWQQEKINCALSQMINS